MIGTKLPKAGGQMAGNIDMNSSEVTGLPNLPTAASHAASKFYVDDQFSQTVAASVSKEDAQKLAIHPNNTTFTLSDGVTTGNSALHHANAAAASALTALSQGQAAIAAYDSFDDRYLGAKSSAPTLDNDGDALITGALYFDSTTNKMNMYTGSAWSIIGDVANRTRTTHTAGSTGSNTFNVTYDQTQPETLDVYLNGVKLVVGTDVTASNGTSIDLTATQGDTVEMIVMSPFNQANVGTASTKNVGISNNQVPIFTSGAVTGDYLKINGTSIEGKDIAEIKTELGISATGATLIDDANVSDMRTTLGLGTMATETATNYAQLSGATFTGDVLVEGGLKEDHNTGSLTNSNQTLTLDFSTGNNFEVTLVADITAIVISNMPTTGTAYAFTLKVVQDATQDRTIAWNSVTDGASATYNIRWHGGTLPTLSTGGAKTDVFCFFTTDQGSNIYGFTAGQNMS